LTDEILLVGANLDSTFSFTAKLGMGAPQFHIFDFQLHDNYDGTSWNGYYQHNVSSFIKSPIFDCSGLTNVGLKFQRWLNIQAGMSPELRQTM